MHDIIGDIIDWDETRKAYLADAGETSERYLQRIEAAERMAEIEARWQHLPGGFHGERKRVKLHIRAVADTGPLMSNEELCWLAITAASLWVPSSATTQAASSRSQAVQTGQTSSSVVEPTATQPQAPSSPW